MTSRAHPRPFLDVSEAETSADPTALVDVLSEAARDADRLGLPEVKEHIEAALAHVAECVEDEGGTWWRRNSRVFSLLRQRTEFNVVTRSC